MQRPETVPVFDVGPDLKRGVPECHLRLVGPVWSAAELIEARVTEAVAQANADRQEVRSFYEHAVERQLNARQPQLSLTTEITRALGAFRSNRFLLFVDDYQLEGLDEKVQIRPESRISFVRLVPLAGG